MGCADVGCDAHSGEVRYFFFGALFDGNLIAGREGVVDGGKGRGYVKGYAIFTRDYRDSVGADFVRGIAVARNSVGADYYGSDAAGLQEMADHVVGDQGERDAVLVALPGGEARPLQKRSGYRNDHFDSVPPFDSHADNSQGGADAGGCEGASVTLGHHAAALGQEFGAEASDAFVAFAALFVDF